mmetsp:Transcript_13048/g.28982  ORF Transcript_13048/g.28982 Transcript_13048/m.28982 type:complete len:231 (-) Transcript_13048:425-1117(-)
MLAARLPSALADSLLTASLGDCSAATKLGMAVDSAIMSMFTAISARFATVAQASLASSAFVSRRNLTTVSSPPFLQMGTLLASAKESTHRAGKTCLCISASSVRARYNTGSSPPSSVTTVRTSAFWAIFTTANAAYCRTSASLAVEREISMASMPSSTKVLWFSVALARFAIASTAYLCISSSTSSDLARLQSGSSTPHSISTPRNLGCVHRLQIPIEPTRWDAVSLLSR